MIGRRWIRTSDFHCVSIARKLAQASQNTKNSVFSAPSITPVLGDSRDCQGFGARFRAGAGPTLAVEALAVSTPANNAFFTVASAVKLGVYEQLFTRSGGEVISADAF